MSALQVDPGQLGGLTPRSRPVFGFRPAVRFALAAAATVAWVAFSVRVSEPWRSELAAALGPVMAWVIPILLAYIPGLVIGFLCFTLLLTRYRPPLGGESPALTVLVAAYNEAEAIERTLGRLAASRYVGAMTIVLADNASTDATAALA